MTQYEAIVSIQELLPLMREAQDPGQVLTKYARDNHLSGAQLEKLAHVYNTQVHVTHLEKCAAHEKGADLDLLDPVQLVQRFHQYEAPPDTMHVKLASQVTQDQYSDSDPYRFVQKSRDRVDTLADRADRLLGSLIETSGPLSGPDQMRKQAASEIESRQELDQDMGALLEQAERAEWGRQACLQKLATVVRREGPFSLMDVERACLYATRQPALTRENMDDLERLCKQAGQLVFRAQDTQVPDTYMPDHLGVYKLARQLNSQTLEGRAARLVWEAKKRDLEDPFLKLATTFPNPRRVWTDQEMDQVEIATGRSIDDFMNPYQDEWEREHGRQAQLQRAQEKLDREEAERLNKLEAEQKEERKRQEAEFVQTGDSVQKLLTTTSQSAQTGLREMREQIPDQSAAMNTYLTLMGAGKNEREKAVRNSLTETVASTALQNVLMRDRVVRQADPNQVVRLYESIRQIRPEVVQNEPLLTFMLREALQYDALPLHTVSALELDRKARGDAKTRELEYRTERDRTIEQVGARPVRA